MESGAIHASMAIIVIVANIVRVAIIVRVLIIAIAIFSINMIVTIVEGNPNFRSTRSINLPKWSIDESFRRAGNEERAVA